MMDKVHKEMFREPKLMSTSIRHSAVGDDRESFPYKKKGVTHVKVAQD